MEVRLKESTTWADAGYTMAWQQFTLQERSSTLPDVATAADAPLTLTENDGRYTISGKHLRMVIDKTSATVTALRSAAATSLPPTVRLYTATSVMYRTTPTVTKTTD